MNPHPTSLAAYAATDDRSRGRRYEEPAPRFRGEFQRDRDRIIHSTAFRRLVYKTQVFVNHEGDLYRTRLTHSIEVAQIARTIARALGLDEDLTECLALAHDLGHTCFGHAGEDALDAAMKDHGGFDHNAHTLRLLTELECRHIGFDGLNLTWESLEGVVKHNGPVTGSDVPGAIVEFDRVYPLDLSSYASAEAQVAALSDDIAYNAHDLDDGLRAGLFGEDDLADTPLFGPIFAEIRKQHPGIDAQRRQAEAVREAIGRMVEDLLTETRARLRAWRPRDADAVRDLGKPLVGFSDAMRADIEGVRKFLFARMYRHAKVVERTDAAKAIVRDLFARYCASPDLLPEEWRRREPIHRAVADYIAGMTDLFAQNEHRRLCISS
ncbi:MAG: deoxyguanosinetriphosphate triphosphohydrolase [Proteobacteria bacterium]|nr:deoxyguanosinetriphosphate triphosphohydrolase [Pseudomonadota bacterium]